MSVDKKIEKYSNFIWNDQLPKDEESFLFDLLQNKNSTSFGFDLESDYALFLAYNASLHIFEGYSEEQTVELKRILAKNKTEKLIKIPTMAKVFKMLNDNDIIPVVVKGAAMMAYYAPEMPRQMGDIDIYINPNQYDQAMKLILDNGFEFVVDTGYHIEVASKNLEMDVHRYIYKNGGDIDSDIYNDLVPVNFLGSKIYVLSPKNMLVHQLVNRGRDLYTFTHMKRHLKWIIDCYYILNFVKPDALELYKEAEKLQSSYEIIAVLNKLVELFPDKFNNAEQIKGDKTYAKLLKITVKRIKNGRKLEGKKIKGLRYIFQWKYFMKWNDAKVVKLTSKSKKSTFKIMLEMEGIYSIKQFFSRSKRLAKNSAN